MSSRKRGRSQGRFESGEHFCVIPASVLTSAAWTKQPHVARSVLTAITAQYRGTNNGSLGLPRNAARAYGLTHKDLVASLPLLEAAGLIERTRQGSISNGRGICNLYAISWKPLDPSEKYDVPLKAQQPASNAWARWNAPPDWQQTVVAAKRKAQGRARPLSSREDSAGPRDGTVVSKIRSSREERLRKFPGPHGEDTSEILGGVAKIHMGSAT